MKPQKIDLIPFFQSIPSRECQDSPFLGFRSQGTRTHLTIRFCAFSDTLGCLNIRFLPFCGKSLCVPGFPFLGTELETDTPNEKEQYGLSKYLNLPDN